MNSLPGIITQIQKSGAILLVDLEVEENLFSALLIESNPQENWLHQGNRVKIIFKETEVSLAKNLSGKISLRNRMKCRVLRILRGDLLSMVTLWYANTEISSAITSRSLDALQILPGDEVEALVKSNEISIQQYQ